MRRFGPLYALLGLAVLTLLARLWDVQVSQHEVWAAESVNLVRSHSVEPYVRGAIRDRNGKLISHDEEVYALDFVWREFRRGHPLGQVTMMRSLAKMRPVGLNETSSRMVELALAYASLSPADLERFGKGEALELPGSEYVPAIALDEDADDRGALARNENRRGRAGDIGFYVVRMLDLSRREQRKVRDYIEEEGGKERSYLDLAGQATGRTTEEVAANLQARVADARIRLARLASLIEFQEDELDEEIQGLPSKEERLVEIIEGRRREVEDDSADQLFRIAAGFSPRRLSAGNLALFDLDWLAAALDWDELRLDEWRRSRAALFREGALFWMANHTIARSKIIREGAEDPKYAGDRLLSAIVHAFREDPDGWSRKHAWPQGWREVEQLEVLATLPDRLVGGGALEAACEAPLFGFQDPAFETEPLFRDELLLGALQGLLPDGSEPGFDALDESPVSYYPPDVVEQLLELTETWRRDWDPEDRDLVSRILARMNDKLQERVAEVLPMAAKKRGRVQLEDVFIEKAKETRRYVVRDRGARSRTIGKEPSIDVVLLVTRYPEDFAGFRATRRTERRLEEMGPDGETPLASRLIGRVRSPYLVDILANRPDLEELAFLRRKLDLPEQDKAKILALIDDSYQPGESIGGSGLEAWFDRELQGKNGVLEVQGLQDRVEGNRSPIYRGAEDGEDIVLTLDVDLQRAAEGVLMAPEVPDDPKADKEWFARPVGAIVLATVEGEILAAASWPAQPFTEDDAMAERRDGEQRHVRERTLGRAVGIPPGSVVKPLMAAYALEFLGLDPRGRAYVCDADEPRIGTAAHEKSNKRAGWGAVNCNSTYGHSHSLGRPIAMRDALCYSCNVYFAGIAEELFDPGHMIEVYRTFGFNQPTGVRWSDDGTRLGLRDDWRAGDRRFRDPESYPASPRDRQFLGNGLTHINANPVQVARAYAGLATGHLPSMTLVREVRGEEVPRHAKAIPISERNLTLVREAVREVLTDRRSSAYGKGLSEEDLGFVFACKTGSADYRDGIVQYTGTRSDRGPWVEGVRKHTWIGGWFPYDEPRYVLSVLCHDTSSTASHSAIYVAGQFLKTPEVQKLMGVEK